MANKLVFIPVSYKENFSMSANVSHKKHNKSDLYLKNAIVALKSVKINNPDVDVAIITNFPLTTFYHDILNKHNILQYQCDFIDYEMPPHFIWSLAFYKITTIKWVIENLDYDFYLQLESDEICINSLDDMWKELESKILTVFSPFRYEHSNRVKYSKLFNEFNKSSTKVMIEKTGAGFIAGSKSLLKHFIEISNKVYNYIKERINEVSIDIGDELYTSIYCALYPEKVGRANPYADIYWTKNFYLVSTNYMYDPVSIIHLPSEKTSGLIYLYKYLVKRGKLPHKKKIYKIMGFPKSKPPFNFGLFIKRCIKGFSKRVLKILNK